MTCSSIGCLNLFDTSLLVRSDHYCGHCGVHSECFSLLGNGMRHLVIHLLDTDSDIYAAVNDMSLSHYQPAKAYIHNSVGSSVSTGSGSITSICAAMSCTNHTVGMRSSLRYCSKFCFDSDNGTVSTRSDLVDDVSVVAPRHEPCDTLTIHQSQDMAATLQCSSVLQRMHSYLPDDTNQVCSATRHRVSTPFVFYDISTSESNSNSELPSAPGDID